MISRSGLELVSVYDECNDWYEETLLNLDTREYDEVPFVTGLSAADLFERSLGEPFLGEEAIASVLAEFRRNDERPYAFIFFAGDVWAESLTYISYDRRTDEAGWAICRTRPGQTFSADCCYFVRQL